MRSLPQRPTSTAARSRGSRPTGTCASTPATTRSTPRLVGRGVELRVSQREVLVVALEGGSGVVRTFGDFRQTAWRRGER
jgi:hypothetical protein